MALPANRREPDLNAALNQHDLRKGARALSVAIALAFDLLLASSPALAHKDHRRSRPKLTG